MELVSDRKILASHQDSLAGVASTPTLLLKQYGYASVFVCQRIDSRRSLKKTVPCLSLLKAGLLVASGDGSELFTLRT